MSDFYDVGALQDDRMVKIWYESKKCKFVSPVIVYLHKIRGQID